ncbi:cytochrome P450 CYP5282A1 [Delphinella strobiligena]|nr:cytochrome P450 CYP5282A1 [Delphinella strobiligena]
MQHIRLAYTSYRQLSRLTRFHSSAPGPLLFAPGETSLSCVFFRRMTLALTIKCRSFWQGALKASKTGNFSFRLGKRHVVGISGPAARKMFYDHPNLDLVSGAILLPFGVHFWPPVHDIFKPGINRARNNTFFLRRLIEMMKTDKLEKHLRDVIGDARADFEVLSPKNPSGVINSPDIWRTVLKQNCRLFFTEDIANDPELLAKTSVHVDVLLHTYSPFNVMFPWLPAPKYIKRRLARYGLQCITQGLYNKRIRNGALRKDDPLQTLIDNGDPADYINEFFVSACFITTTNAHVVAAQMINTMAVHTGWQEKIFGEVVAAANRHSKDKDAKLVDKLSSIPLSAWESSFPSIDLCLKETIRVWTSFPVSRLNTSSEPIRIPGSDEVVPGNTFVIYNSTEMNFSEKLYPKSTKFDPERYTERREEFKKEAYGFFGWGNGVHPCAGMRWAKLQQNIIVAHALALYKWSSCDVNGKPDPYAAQRQGLGSDLDSDTPFALPPAYCKFKPREKV